MTLEAVTAELVTTMDEILPPPPANEVVCLPETIPNEVLAVAPDS